MKTKILENIPSISFKVSYHSYPYAGSNNFDEQPRHGKHEARKSQQTSHGYIGGTRIPNYEVSIKARPCVVI